MTGKSINQSNFTSFYKEKKEVQRIWNGLTINNSWEKFVVNIPHSLSAIGKYMFSSVAKTSERLTVESLKGTYVSSFSAPSTLSNSSSSLRRGRAFTEIASTTSDFTIHSGDSIFGNVATSALRPHIMEVIHETRTAFIKTIQAMNTISENGDKIPRLVEQILKGLSEVCQSNINNFDEQKLKKFREKFTILQKIVENCAYSAFSLETVFSPVEKLYDSEHRKIVRKDFMLLNEVKHSIQNINGFFLEISKLVEFALDTSCNLMIKRIIEEVNTLQCQPKYVVKLKTYKEEIDEMIKADRFTAKRPSVVEIDFGLDLHLSEIISDINGPLFMMENVSSKLGAVPLKDENSIKIHMNNFVDRLRKKFSKTSKDRSNTL
uniref:Uncharacterized protein n=1 Tax=Syphacia muris TaxID=451379 RepID=A0A0N5AK49_9BILA